MQKAHSNINWVNLPSTDTPINETNLNAMDNSIDVIDDRVIVLDTSKANQSDLLSTVSDVVLDTSTGVLTITFKNGSSKTFDTKLEKIAINFYYDANPSSVHYQNLVITLDDGTIQYVDMSALITQYEFTDTDTIDFNISQGGGVSAIVKDGSITRSKLNPDYLSQIDLSVQSASNSATASENSAVNSLTSSRDSEAWAIGKKNGVDVLPQDPQYENNSRYYAQQAQSIKDECDVVLDEVIAGANQVTFTVDFTTGELMYSSNAIYNFEINTTTGNLEWEVVVNG